LQYSKQTNITDFYLAKLLRYYFNISKIKNSVKDTQQEKYFFIVFNEIRWPMSFYLNIVEFY